MHGQSLPEKQTEIYAVKYDEIETMNHHIIKIFYYEVFLIENQEIGYIF